MTTDNKLRQVTDTIHGSIFLSGLESAMIATPYFFRLHDIYQSSTVYMTYPSNRTKRYEHSLGTMQLASRMLFSAVSNADDNTRAAFFNELLIRFDDISRVAINNSNNQNIAGGYYNQLRTLINHLFANRQNANANETIWNSISAAKSSFPDSSIFTESALDEYQFFPLATGEDGAVDKQFFSYRCLLQSVRIVALFHDVGHPPFSHILEEALCDLYNRVDELKAGNPEQYNTDKIYNFETSLRQFVVKGEDAFFCHSIYVRKSLSYAETHERIGFSLLQFALDDAIQEMLNGATVEGDYGRALLVYLIVIAEFSMAIWAEKDSFFKSIHKIIDGLLDADRLDYITRDSHNSGVDWGVIPYERIITPMKLILVDEYQGKKLKKSEQAFLIAFPRKLEEDINDILITRYKLFERINYHHRCIKTAKALQTCVKLLAENFLFSNKPDIINEEVSVLWRALSAEAGDKPLRIIQWNDSFLISMLHRSLVTLQNKGGANNTVLLDNLREILLNKKKYYSVIKRGQDCKKFIDLVFKKANISIEDIENFKQIEFVRFCMDAKTDGTQFSMEDIAVVKAANACDSVKRANTLLDLANTGDLDLFDAAGMLDSYTLINNELVALKEEGIITDYHLIKNKGRSKTGIPKHEDHFDEIYLLGTNGRYTTLDEMVHLKPQIKVIEKNIPWIYVYVVPNSSFERLDDNLDKTSQAVQIVFDRLAEALANEIRKNKEMLFGSTMKKGEE